MAYVTTGYGTVLLILHGGVGLTGDSVECVTACNRSLPHNAAVVHFNGLSVHQRCPVGLALGHTTVGSKHPPVAR